MTKASRASANNRSNQMNPNSPAYASSRSSTKAAADNRSNQLNPNSEAYEKSRESNDGASYGSSNAPFPEGFNPWKVPMTDYSKKHKANCKRCGLEVEADYYGSYDCKKCGHYDNSWQWDD